jgi:hypothetical protein
MHRPHSTPLSPGTRGFHARWIFAGVIAIAMALLALGSRYVDSWHVCSTVLIARNPVITSCHPSTLSELAPGLLIIALLLLPEIKELELSGLGRVRMRVDTQEDRSAPREDHVAQPQRVCVSRGQHLSLVLPQIGRKGPDQESPPNLTPRTITAREPAPATTNRPRPHRTRRPNCVEPLPRSRTSAQGGALSRVTLDP